MNLNLKYKLYQQDYLQQILYCNTISENSKKQRLRAWLFVTFFIIFFSFLLIYMYNDKIEMGHYLGIIPMSILGIVFFPYFHKKMLKSQFAKSVNENYKNNFGKESNLSFGQETLEIHNATGESKINYSSLEKVIEISSHFYLVLKAGSYIIIPKSAVENINIFRTQLNLIAKKNEILYSTKLDWKWK